MPWVDIFPNKLADGAAFTIIASSVTQPCTSDGLREFLLSCSFPRSWVTDAVEAASAGKDVTIWGEGVVYARA